MTTSRFPKIIDRKWPSLIIATILVGFLASILAISLKHLTENYENIIYTNGIKYPLLFIILPFIGLSIIYFLRLYLFKNKENKGISEIFESLKTNRGLPSYKIVSHYLNGFITVIFGGSTGIEVSTVVSSAAIGSIPHTKQPILRKFKAELICAGTAAGIAALFTSPIAGLLFVYEVLYKKLSKVFLIVALLAITVAAALSFLLNEKPLFLVNIVNWKLKAIPYFVLLGIIAGINSVYLTKSVLFFKKKALSINSGLMKVALGSALIGLGIYIFPALFGDGYHAVKDNFSHAGFINPTWSVLFTLLGIILLKPIVTSLTLSSGGDGGVFAPSIFIGAFIGLLTALLLNKYVDAQVIPLNFMVAGMAAMLSASINAPLTAIFLICGLVGDYTLFIPILIVSFVAKITARTLCEYTVYTYKVNIPSDAN